MPGLACNALGVLVGLDDQDLGMLGQALGGVRMNVQLAEARAEGLVLLDRELLVTEEDDEVFHRGAMDLFELMTAQLLAEIDAGNLRTDCRSGLAHHDRLVGHCCFLLLVFAWSLEHDPEKCEAVFPRDKRGTRLRGDQARSRIQSAMTIDPGLIALWSVDTFAGLAMKVLYWAQAAIARTGKPRWPGSRFGTMPSLARVSSVELYCTPIR
jgi:hypothetical protein